MTTVDTETGEVIDTPEPEPVDITTKVRNALTTGGMPEVVSSAEIGAAIARRILEQDDPDVMLNPNPPKGLKEDGYLDRPFTLRGVDFTPSTLGGSGGYYALLDVVMADDNEEVVLTCGGLNVVATALNLRERGLLPREVKVSESPEMTSNGYFPLWMVAPDYKWPER